VVTRPRTFLPLITLCVATLTVYLGAFRGGFHYDDSISILQNSHLDGWQGFVGHLDHMVRPVLYASFLLDRSLYGADPTGYHLLNLLLHFGSGLLVYSILSRAVTEKQSSIPFWTALLFLVHPITTEAVTYISGRASGLMAFFYLAALFLHIKASEDAQPMRLRRLYLSGAVTSFLLSVGSKETAVTLPVILLLWDVVIRRLDGPSLRAAVLSRHLPFWLVLLFAAGWAWNHPRYTALAQFSLNIRPLWDNVLSQIHATAYAVTLLFTPWNQNFDHDLPVFHSLTQWPLPLDFLLLAATIAAGLLSRRRFPLVAFSMGWFFIQLLPTSLIPRNDFLSERNLYLPSIGFFLVVVTLTSSVIYRLAALVPRNKFITVGLMCAAIALVLSLGFFTYQRNQLYQDRLLLWSDAVQKSPNKARPHNNLGHAYALHGNWDRAIDEFRTAARLDPDFILAQQNLRDAYLHRVGHQ
jgi:protein O-mannosyl-transferase